MPRKRPIIATDDTIHQIVKDEIKKHGNGVDLNHIDVSNVTNMAFLFLHSSFNGNISKWDVSNVKDMSYMFDVTPFNRDISMWDVSSVTNMECMFHQSKFKGYISQWDVSSVTNMHEMFRHASFNGDISQWDVSSVTNMHEMFYYASFNGDISNWIIHPDCDLKGMLTKQEFILPPLLRIDDADVYALRLREALNYTTTKKLNIKACVTKYPNPTVVHAVYLLLSSSKPQTIHPQLTTEDREQLQMLYQFTGSVYQSVVTWEKQRNRTITKMDLSVV